MQYTLIFTKEPEGIYTVEVAELPGCVSYGDTLEEAKENVKEAIDAYMVSLEKHDEVTDPHREIFIGSLTRNATIQPKGGHTIFAK